MQSLPEYQSPLGTRAGVLLDMNECAQGCSPRVLARLHWLTVEDLCRYPDRRPLEKRIASSLTLSAEQMMLTNGADEALHLLCEAYLESGDSMIIPVPTFSMFEIYARQTGANVVRVLSRERFEIPVEGMLRAIEETRRCKLIAIASPNNPTGAVIRRTDLVQILEGAPNAAVLLDEAYYEFYGRTEIDLLSQFPNLFVARTFSKAYGLAGLRAGVLAGATEQMRVLRRLSSPFNLNAAALACVEEGLADQEHLNAAVAEVRALRARLAEGLNALGFEVFPSEANFLYVRMGASASRIVAELAKRDISIRDRSSDPGGAGCVRITVGTATELEALLAALQTICAQRPVGGAA
ncbi:MAG TPA: histidinol-phosphate transaminase [Terriglobales bacterium]|nr:histidinol-phosphate transaminase [Terriglobales bacterium]